MAGRGAWRGAAVGVLVAIGGTVLSHLLELTFGDGSAFLLGMLLVLAYALGLLAMRSSIGRYYADVRAFVDASSDMPRQHRRFVVDAEGIRTEAEAGTGHWSWRAITEVEAAEGLLLFYVGHVHGFAIPIRGFASPGEADAALAFARGRVAAAHRA